MAKTIEDAMTSLKGNLFLDQDFKVNIGSILIDYVSIKEEVGESVNLDLFCEKITELQISKISPFEPPVSNFKFNPKTNKIVINQEHYNSESVNKDNINAQIVLELLYANKEYSGFGIDGLKSLNNGFREMMAEKLAGSEKKDGIPTDEYLYTNLVGKIIENGADTLLNAYTKNNPSIILNALKNYDLEEINKKAEYNMFRENKNNSSLLCEIELELLDKVDASSKNIIIDSCVFDDEIFDDEKHNGFRVLYNQKNNTVEPYVEDIVKSL